MLNFFGGEGIIQADGTAYGEAAVSHIVRFARGPFFYFGIDDERTHAEFFLIGCGSRGIAGNGVGDFLRGSKSNEVRFRRSQHGAWQSERKRKAQ